MNAQFRYRAFAFLGLLAIQLAIFGCAAVTEATAPDQPEIISASEATPTIISTENIPPSATPTPSWESFLELARGGMAEGKWQEAIAFVEQAIQISGGNEVLYTLLGQAHKASGELEQAEQAFGLALEFNPEFPEAHFFIALLLADELNYPAALDSFQAAIDAEPDYALAYRNRADIHEILGNYEAAALDYQLYLALVPSSPERESLESRIMQLLGQEEANIEESQVLFFDDFSTEGGGWYSNSDEDLSVSFEADGLRLTHAKENSAAWVTSNRIFSDTVIEVTVQRMSGSEDNYFGLMCRIQGTTAAADFYLFMISSDGFYGIAKRIENGDLELLSGEKLKFSPEIRTGSESNILMVECDEDRLALHVNGFLLGEVYDDELVAGQAGLLVGTFTEPGTDILFGDFRVRSISQ